MILKLIVNGQRRHCVRVIIGSAIAACTLAGCRNQVKTTPAEPLTTTAGTPAKVTPTVSGDQSLTFHPIAIENTTQPATSTPVPAIATTQVPSSAASSPKSTSVAGGGPTSASATGAQGGTTEDAGLASVPASSATNSSATAASSSAANSSGSTTSSGTSSGTAAAARVPAAVAGSSNSPMSAASDSLLEQLAQLMCGEFSSADQAARDPDFRDISLKVSRIWPENGDGIWLYVEQAVATMTDRPYRQRVYHLTVVPGARVPTFRSDVFTLPGDAKQFVGATKDPSKLSTVTPASLVAREGCAVMLTMTGPGTFAGSTVDRNCQSEFQKASFATSEVTIQSDAVVSWDRGFDHEGKQVWGATKGGYRFVRFAGRVPALTPAPAVAVPEK
ncbi:MAG: chromophore lyase CpcT/CpeT [Planctomycetes bacterium]|nr:chromophore lyase CpcT/CpeT [Planctomycetota bacterium]